MHCNNTPDKTSHWHIQGIDLVWYENNDEKRKKLFLVSVKIDIKINYKSNSNSIHFLVLVAISAFLNKKPNLNWVVLRFITIYVTESVLKLTCYVWDVEVEDKFVILQEKWKVIYTWSHLTLSTRVFLTLLDLIP